MTKYMVLEYFRPNCKNKIYSRLSELGRMLPEGLIYIDSWLEKDGERCFQLMETDDPALFDVWIANWSDLCRFEWIEIAEKSSDIP